MSSKRAIRYLFAALLILVLFLSVDLHNLVEAFSNMTLEIFVYLILISIALLYISAMKWGLFLGKLGRNVGVGKLFNLYLLGYFVNLLVPSYVGGDIARSYYLGKDVGQHKAFAATILERYTGMVAMVSMAFVFIWISPDVTPAIRWAVILVTIGLAALTVLVLSPASIKVVSRLPILKKLTSHFEKVHEGLLLAKSDLPLLIKSLVYSYLFHVMTVVNTLVCCFAVGGSVQFLKLFVLVPLILMVSALPLAPNSLGIQEGAFFFFLKQAGATSAQALGVAIILRAKSYLLAFLGWFVWLKVNNQKTKNLASNNPGEEIIEGTIP